MNKSIIKLSENIALLCLSKNFHSADNHSIHVLTDLLKDCNSINWRIDIQEMGKEIKSFTELNGRSDSNLFDGLNALYQYEVKQKNLVDHFDAK